MKPQTAASLMNDELKQKLEEFAENIDALDYFKGQSRPRKDIVIAGLIFMFDQVLAIVQISMPTMIKPKTGVCEISGVELDGKN